MLTKRVLLSHSNNHETFTGFCNFFSSQVTTHLEIRKNLPSKCFMSFIETGNKLSLKENFITFCHKKTTGAGDSHFKGKEKNQSFNFRYFGHVLGYSYNGWH